MDKNLGIYDFSAYPNKRERLFLWVYLPIHALILPIAIGLLFPVAEDSNLGMINFLYYALGAVLAVGFCWRFLRQGFDLLCDRFIPCLFTVLFGYLATGVLNSLYLTVLTLLGGGISNMNNQVAEAAAQAGYGPMLAAAVFLAPILEELLFRGGIFAALRKKHRALAYVVTVFLFCFYHVWQYLLVSPEYLLSMLDYLAISIMLCWTYDRTGTIWTPILLHMLVNWISALATFS